MVEIKAKKGFFKVVVIEIDVLESKVIDERNFATMEQLDSYKATLKDADNLCMVERYITFDWHRKEVYTIW